MSSSSSESDDGEEQRLKEAVIDVIGYSDSSKISCIANGQVSTQEETPVTFNGTSGIAQKKPSKRLTKSDEYNELNTTPEFKTFIARKLSTFLDSSVKFSKKANGECDNDSSADNTGFRLFSTSCGQWLNDDEVYNKSKPRKKRHKSSSSESSSENERLLEAAVTEESIFVPVLTESRECMKSDNNQVLLNIQISKTADEDQDSDSVNSCKKKKKKKRKK